MRDLERGKDEERVEGGEREKGRRRRQRGRGGDRRGKDEEEREGGEGGGGESVVGMSLLNEYFIGFWRKTIVVAPSFLLHN